MKMPNLAIMYWGNDCSFIRIDEFEKGKLASDNKSKIYHVRPLTDKNVISCCVDSDCINKIVDLQRGSIIELDHLFSGTKKEKQILLTNFDEKELQTLKYVYEYQNKIPESQIKRIEDVLFLRMKAKYNLAVSDVELDKILDNSNKKQQKNL